MFKKHRLLQPYAILLCEYGHILLALEKSADMVEDKLQEASSLLKELGVAKNSELGIAVRRLQSALETYKAGKPLWVGSVKEELTFEIRESLSI